MAWFSKKKPASAAADPLNGLDLAFIVDATGSMGPFIDAARELFGTSAIRPSHVHRGESKRADPRWSDSR